MKNKTENIWYKVKNFKEIHRLTSYLDSKEFQDNESTWVYKGLLKKI